MEGDFDIILFMVGLSNRVEICETKNYSNYYELLCRFFGLVSFTLLHPQASSLLSFCQDDLELHPFVLHPKLSSTFLFKGSSYLFISSTLIRTTSFFTISAHYDFFYQFFSDTNISKLSILFFSIFLKCPYLIVSSAIQLHLLGRSFDDVVQ